MFRSRFFSAARFSQWCWHPTDVSRLFVRYRVVFGIKTESMLLGSEMKSHAGGGADASLRALSIAESMALTLRQQLISAVDGDQNSITTTDRELASFEELVGIFGAHATVSTSEWWRRVGVSSEERKRVTTLTASLELPQGESTLAPNVTVRIFHERKACRCCHFIVDTTVSRPAYYHLKGTS